MKYCVIFFALLISVGCSTSLHQRDIRECRESTFLNQAMPMALIEAKYKECLNNKKEIQETERQMALIENVLEILLAIFGVKDPD